MPIDPDSQPRTLGSRDVVRRPSYGALLLALVPFTAMCFSVPLWDRVHPMILGLPFNLFWLLSWIVLTPVCLRAAYSVETSRDSEGTGMASSERPTR